VVGIAALGAAAIAAACTPFAANDSAPSSSTEKDASTGDPGGLNTTGVGAGTGADTGLPCDVQQLLENRCIACHLATSPIPLLTYDDLEAPSTSDPTKNRGELSAIRMQSTGQPMPPPPAAGPTADEIATFTTWINDGMQKAEACTPPVPAADAGAPDTTNYFTPLVCTSKTYWNNGSEIKTQIGGPGGFGGPGIGGPGGDEEQKDVGSPNMSPGMACLTCHEFRGGPAFTIAGTVFPTAHEPDNCNGIDGTKPATTVVITGHDGTVSRLPVNAVGNFSLSTKVVAPFTVQVTNGTKTRSMKMAITAGDCNSCHTVQGFNFAPGRIMAP
jgi:hypothetical protein